MSSKRGWVWVAGAITVASAITVGGWRAVRDPLVLPGSHEVSVYALDQGSTQAQEVGDGPDAIGRALGLCDFDSYYVVDGGRKLCLVLDGPLGGVRASRSHGQVTVAAADVDRLRAMAATKSASTLVLMGGRPNALVEVGALAAGQPVSVRALT